MHITIEIPDASLRAAVEAQVGEALATMTHAVIKAKADEIITTVFARFDPYAVARAAAENAVRPHIVKVVDDVLGVGYHQRRENVERLIKEVAGAALKGGLK